MIKIKIKITILSGILVFFSLAYAACRDVGNQLRTPVIDTIIKENEVVVLYQYDLDTVQKPVILRTSTLMISDSATRQDERYRVLDYDNRKIDSVLNYPHFGRDLIINHYKLIDNLLSFEIFYTTAEGWYFLGDLENSEGSNMVFKKGDHIELNVRSRPSYSRLLFEVYVPPGHRFDKLIFRSK